jgi:four helix bundle suffix protein
VAQEARRAEEKAGQRGEENINKRRQTRTREAERLRAGRVGPFRLLPTRSLPAVLSANGALQLLNLCTCFLDQQLPAQASAFENKGGSTERL